MSSNTAAAAASPSPLQSQPMIPADSVAVSAASDPPARSNASLSALALIRRSLAKNLGWRSSSAAKARRRKSSGNNGPLKSVRPGANDPQTTPPVPDTNVVGESEIDPTLVQSGIESPPPSNADATAIDADKDSISAPTHQFPKHRRATSSPKPKLPKDSRGRRPSSVASAPAAATGLQAHGLIDATAANRSIGGGGTVSMTTIESDSGKLDSQFFKLDPLRSSRVERAETLVKFLQEVAGNTPVLGTMAKLLEVMLGIEKAVEDNQDKASFLFSRVVFVVDTVRILYDLGRWHVENADRVLEDVCRALAASAQFLFKFRAQTVLQRRFYSSQNRQRLELLDAHLNSALTHLSINLQLETVLRLEPTTDYASQDELDVQVESFIQFNGGPLAIQSNPQKVSELAQLVGVEFNSTLVTEISGTFEDLERQLSTQFDAVLAAMVGHSVRLEEVGREVLTLTRRGAAYQEIQCSEIRELWKRAGWGLAVPVRRLAEVLQDEVRAEAGAARADGRLDKEVMSVVMDQFPIALQRLDPDGVRSQADITVAEVNTFFPWDLSLLDWALVVLFVIDDFETRQYRTAFDTCRAVCAAINDLPYSAPYSTFFHLLKIKLSTLGDYCQTLRDNQFTFMDAKLYFDQLDHANAALAQVQAALQLSETSWNSWLTGLRRRHANASALLIQSRLLSELQSLQLLIEHLCVDPLCLPPSSTSSMRQEGGGLNASSVAAWQDVSWEDIQEVAFALGAVCEELDPDAMFQITTLAMQASTWYGWMATWDTDDWTCKYDFFVTTMDLPFPLTAWMPSKFERDLPTNAVVGGMLRGKPVYIVRGQVQRGACHDLVPSYAFEGPRAEWQCVVPSAMEAKHAVLFDWLTRGRGVHHPSTINDPANRVLVWKPMSLDDAPYPRAGVIGVELPHHQTYCARYRFSPDTILPGKLLIEDGQVHFEVVCPLSASGLTTEISDVSDDKEALFSTRISPESETTTRRSLPRSGVQLEILLADQSNIFFYRHFEWNTLADAQLRGCQPIVAGGTPSNPAYIAWCVAGDKMQFGMVFAGESCAMYGVGASCSGHSTATFRVLTGKPGKAFHSSVYNPHPLLRWKQVDRDLGVVVDNHRSIRAVQVTSTPDQKAVMIARGLAARLVDGRPANGNRTYCVGQYTQAPRSGGSEFEFAFLDKSELGKIEALMVDATELFSQFPVAMRPWLRARESESGGANLNHVLFDLGVRFEV